MEYLRTHNIQNTSLLFILLTPFTIIYYAIYVFNPQNAGNVFLYVLQLVADFIAITIVGSLWITILLDIILPENHKRSLKHNSVWLTKNKPSVDILITTANEPYEVVKQTVYAAIDIDYPHKTYLLDDGNSSQLRVLAKQLNIEYFARREDQKQFAKSGNLNFGLSFCKGKYFAVFDADHVPSDSFLTELLPFFENKEVALVQAPQHYINTDKFIASGTAQSQEIFYKFVQPAKNSYNAAFCVGTNMLYRRSAIDAIGGITLLDHSEDIWTSILLHENGYESVFYNKILAEGHAPETIQSFSRQQNRWAQGGFSLFFTHNPLFISKLTLDQRLQYFFTNIHYFSAFAIMIYLFIPIIYLLFGIFPLHIHNNAGWIYHYIPYFLTIYFLPLFLLGKFQLSTVSTSLASFFPYLKAFITIVLKNDYKWIATGSGVSRIQIIAFELWPHIFIIVLSLCSILVGWYNIQDYYSTLVTTFWVFINAYLLFAFIKNGVLK